VKDDRPQSANGFVSQSTPDILTLGEASALVVGRAHELVKQLTSATQRTDPPFNAREYARLVGIKGVVEADLGEVGAALLRYSDGHVVEVNRNHHPVRQNFSIGHEVGHIILDELNLTRVEDTDFRTFSPQTHSRARSRTLEHLCDVAASELIMPEAVFKRYLSASAVSIQSVGRLATAFGVSFQAAAIRITEVSEEACLAILWNAWPKKRRKGFRVTWCVGPGKNLSWKRRGVPLHMLASNVSALGKAYDGDETVKSRRLFQLDGSVTRVFTESKGFGRGETRYVLSLAFPQR